MAEVFVARKRGAQGTFKVLVVKRILPSFGHSRRFKAMFIEEAQLATRLNHPNVVQVYELLDAGDEGHILAMEHVEGLDLGALMSAARQAKTPIGAWLSAWIVSEAAKGLHYAHEKKDEQGAPLEIVHRDVSPQNVLLSFEGSVKITDFGIASVRMTEEQEGVIKGKFGYMSPEQARGERVDRRSDLYALGVILWECVTGRPLHGGLGGEALLDMVRSGIVEPPSVYAPDVPPELEAIIMKLLSKERESRYATGKEVTQAILRALVGAQQLIDASSLETRIVELAPPSARHQAEQDEEARTHAAAPVALGQAQSRKPPRSDAGISEVGHREPREVRHVILLSLRLGIGDALSALSDTQTRKLAPIRRMLDEMAYKRGMRFVWNEDGSARAIAGLSARHGRAPTEACSLALEAHEAIAAYAEEWEEKPSAAFSMVRGVAAGHRDLDGNLVRFVLNDPVTQLADALAEEAQPHATWIAGGLFRLVRRDFMWGETREVTLLGRSSASGVPLPAYLKAHALVRRLSKDERAREREGQLVGRELELADLHSAFHAVQRVGQQQTLWRIIVGELGIGKTALLSAFLDEVLAESTEEDLRVLRLECTPVSQEVPFGAVAELVKEATGITGDEPFEVIAERIARIGGGAAAGDASHPAVARLAEIAANTRKPGAGEEDAVDQRKALQSGLRSMLAAIALSGPMLLALDGLQWADRQSLDVFIELLRSPDPLPILVVCATRPDDRVRALLEDQVRIELDVLDTDEQVRLLEARLGVRQGVRAACQDLFPRAGGNPHFLLEMVDALLERGVLLLTEGEAADEGPALVRNESFEPRDMGAMLPSTLEQLIADRLAELPREERVVVDWLAVAGGPLGESELGDLASLVTDEPYDRLAHRGICERRGTQLEFRHPLTRDVAYAALGPDLRARMHAELGELLEQTALARGLSAAVVARHFHRGGIPSRAADYYMEAGHAARAGFQLQLATRYYRRALANLSPDDARNEVVLEALENLYRAVGNRAERVKVLGRLRRLAKTSQRPRLASLALARLARFQLDEGQLSRGLPLAQAAAALSQQAGLAALAIETEELLSEFLREMGDVQGALAACDRALAACDPRDRTGHRVSRRVYAEVLRSRGILLRRVGRVREAVDAYAEALAYARKTGARRLEARTKNAMAYAMFVQGRYEDAVVLAHESIQIDLAMGGRFQVAKTLTNIGHAYSRLGDGERADAFLRRAREAHERYSDHDSHADTLIVCAEVALEADDVSGARKFLEEAGRLIEATGNAYDSTHAKLVGAVLARAERDAHTAIQLALEARRAAENQALVSYTFYGMAVEAAARVDAGEMHAGTLLATTALGAAYTLQGCEYGLEIRALTADALKRAGSPQAPSAMQSAMDYSAAMLKTIRDKRLRRLFVTRPIVAALFDTTPIPGMMFPNDELAPASSGNTP
jgi:tetratricopeptide (TPR) repeat protein